MKIVEVHGFNIKFSLDKNSPRNELFSINRFNYGGATFYQRFKSRVPSNLHQFLKEIKDLNLYVNDCDNQIFEFTLVHDCQKEAVDPSLNFVKNLVEVCKAVHDYKDNVDVTISKVFIAEEDILGISV